VQCINIKLKAKFAIK